MSSRYDDVVVEQRRQRDRADRLERERRQDVEGDLVIEMPRRLLLRSANGTYFAIGVSDAGALTAVNVGTKL